MKQGSDIKYVHQDHLTGTSLMTDTSGNQIDTTMKYLPFGETRAGSVPTDKKFTGQRLDDTGLYYYGARYYDPLLGRFISPDTIIPNPANPQTFNRYSYVLNNPLKYTDPSGHIVEIGGVDVRDMDAVMASGDAARLYNLAMVMHNAGIANLFAAYMAFRGVTPELAGYLEGSPTIIHLSSQDLGNPIEGTGGASTRDFLVTGDIFTVINSQLDNIDTRATVAALAHEMFHDMIFLKLPGAISSIANEAFAWAFGAQVGYALGYDIGTIWQVTYSLADINPWTSSTTSDFRMFLAYDQLQPGYSSQINLRNVWGYGNSGSMLNDPAIDFIGTAREFWVWSLSPWAYWVN